MIAARLNKIISLSGALLLFAGPAWTAPGGTPGPNPNAPGIIKKAPEIDASSGVSAIALLVGVIMLVRERSRSRDS